MNKYAVISFRGCESKSDVVDTILIKYEDTKPEEERPWYSCFKGVSVISSIPEELEIVEISDSKFRWKPDEISNFYGDWEDISSENIPVFEALDDDAAKLIFEVGGYE